MDSTTPIANVDEQVFTVIEADTGTPIPFAKVTFIRAGEEVAQELEWLREEGLGEQEILQKLGTTKTCARDGSVLLGTPEPETMLLASGDLLGTKHIGLLSAKSDSRVFESYKSHELKVLVVDTKAAPVPRSLVRVQLEWVGFGLMEDAPKSVVLGSSVTDEQGLANVETVILSGTHTFWEDVGSLKESRSPPSFLGISPRPSL